LLSFRYKRLLAVATAAAAMGDIQQLAGTRVDQHPVGLERPPPPKADS
jgi:hypothetical protein